MNRENCLVDGCFRVEIRSGLCMAHYDALMERERFGFRHPRRLLVLLMVAAVIEVALVVRWVHS